MKTSDCSDEYQIILKHRPVPEFPQTESDNSISLRLNFDLKVQLNFGHDSV